MRQSIICVCSLFAFSSIVLAQGGLFPELKFSEEESTVPETVEEKTDTINEQSPTMDIKETVSEEKIEITPQTSEISQENLEENEESDDEEEENEEEEKVYIALNNVKATITAVRAVSYCNADFMVYNGFKKRPVNELSVSLKIGTIDKVFSFKNIKPEETTGQNFMIVGDSCEYIYKTPAIDIQKCQIKGVSDKKCKEKIEFIPIPQNNTEMGN